MERLEREDRAGTYPVPSRTEAALYEIYASCTEHQASTIYVPTSGRILFSVHQSFCDVWIAVGLDAATARNIDVIYASVR